MAITNVNEYNDIKAKLAEVQAHNNASDAGNYGTPEHRAQTMADWSNQISQWEQANPPTPPTPANQTAATGNNLGSQSAIDTQQAMANGTYQIPQSQQQQATLLQENPNEIQNTPGLQGNVNAGTTTAGQSQQAQAPNATQAQTVNPYLVGAQNAAQGTAAQVNQTGTEAQAAQGTVDPNSLVQNQVKNILETDTNHDGKPDFAQSTMRNIDEQMAARGLGASSIAAEATAFGVLNSVFPMAQFNANIYAELNKINLNNQQQANLQNASQKFQAAMANMSAEQQTSMQNLQNRQQVLLTDQSMENASKQFNAQSEQQNQQFMANLMSQISLNNAQRADAMNQFNAGQTNSMEQFNAQLKDAREKFNVENQRIIDQSNVTWRRSINAANTAAINAVNQMNAQNAFNLTSQAQANLWQQWRDEASWANTAAENDKTRAHNLAVAAIQRSTYFDGLAKEQQSELFSGLGTFAVNLLNNVMKP